MELLDSDCYLLNLSVFTFFFESFFTFSSGIIILGTYSLSMLNLSKMS